MKLITETLLKRVSNVTDDINQFKTEFEELPKYSEFKNNFEDLKKIIYESEENQLLDIFVRNKQRAERCIVQKFKVKVFDGNSTNNSNASNNSNTCSFTVSVVDLVGPTMTNCTGNKVVIQNAPNCVYKKVGTDWNAGATDNCTIAAPTYVLTGATTGTGAATGAFLITTLLDTPPF